MTLTLENLVRNTVHIEVDSIEIPHGFKITELGLLPEDWQVIPFGLIATVRKTKFDPRTLGEKKIFCVELEHISQRTGALEGNTFTSSKSSIKALFCKGDILFGKLRAYLRKYWLANRNGVASTEIWPIIPNLNCSLSEYIFFIIQTDRFIEAASIAYGTHMPRSDWNAIATLKVSLPPLPQQRAIAAALSDIDSMINGLDQLIAKKRNIKLATMQQLLTGKQRLPGFKNEWSMRKIGEFTDCLSGGTPSTFVSDYWGGSIRWMSSGELNLKTIMDVEGRITEKGLHNSSTKMIPRKCVLIGLAGQGKTRGTVAINLIELCTNQSIAAILPNNQFIPEYLYYNLDARYEELRGLSTGDGGRGGVNLTIIRSLEIPFPKIEEQAAIAKVLTEMDTELSTLEQQLSKARNLKQGMMQELLTGRIRLT